MSVNSANARNKAVVAAKSVVAVNKAVVSKAGDKPDCIRLMSGGRRLPPLSFCVCGQMTSSGGKLYSQALEMIADV